MHNSIFCSPVFVLRTYCHFCIFFLLTSLFARWLFPLLAPLSLLDVLRSAFPHVMMPAGFDDFQQHVRKSSFVPTHGGAVTCSYRRWRYPLFQHYWFRKRQIFGQVYYSTHRWELRYQILQKALPPAPVIIYTRYHQMADLGPDSDWVVVPPGTVTNLW